VKTPPRTMVALITPFDDAGAIDGRAHRHNLGMLTEWGLDGFLVGGSTGLGPYLEAGERTTLAGVARDELGSSAFLLAGVSAQSVRQATAQIEEAAQAEADAALVITPTLLLRKDAALVQSFFLAVADASALPVFCYSVPAVTGYELPVEAVLDIASHPNIVGMKDSGGDPDRIEPILNGVDDAFMLYTGASRLVNEAARRGAYGAITASANYTPELVAAARVNADAQDRLTAIASNVEWHGVAGTYAAASMVGLEAGSMRLPLVRLDDATAEKMRAVCCPAANR
jgi:dihydrodipicolinate synthase/N-acetylneuraminate lyase